MTTQTTNLLEEIALELSNGFQKLREGDYYGDPAPDSLADIAKSLRIISGREKLTNK
tara:strand:+ start:93 stop:263 length:171 start_codon:yes stop_codon:yes gene_type:complete